MKFIYIKTKIIKFIHIKDRKIKKHNAIAFLHILQFAKKSKLEKENKCIVGDLRLKIKFISCFYEMESCF